MWAGKDEAWKEHGLKMVKIHQNEDGADKVDGNINHDESYCNNSCNDS